MLDMTGIPIVDNHCHAYLRPTAPLDVSAFRRLFSEANQLHTAHDHVHTAVYYRWALKEIGRILGCPASEEEVLARRAEYSEADYAKLLLGEAAIDTMLIDTGLGGEEFHSLDEMRALTGCRVEWVLRLETLAQKLIVANRDFDAFDDALTAELTGLRERGVVSLKSIAAYRSGLDIRPVSPEDAEAAFSRVRELIRPEGRLRLADKTLVDYLVCRAMAHAATEELPIQFHTGYGDPDTDLRLGNPLHLRYLFEEPTFEPVSIIMLHESYPFTREAAYLAAVYPNAYLDISYSIPFLDYHELLACTNQALGAAPWSKILYSSDGHSIPEHGWLGAIHGRRVLADALDQRIALGELDADEARAAATAIFGGNSRKLYRLDPS
jgi:predicted TIM-barrel fold metal-dependent hydrolase